MSRGREIGTSHWLLLGVSIPGVAVGAFLSVLSLSAPQASPEPDAGAALHRAAVTAAVFQPIKVVSPSARTTTTVLPKAKDGGIPAPKLAWNGNLTRTARADLADPLGTGFLHVTTTTESGSVVVPSLSASAGFSSAGYFLSSAPFETASPGADDGEDLRPLSRALNVDGSVVLEKDGKKIFFGGLSEAEFRAKEKRCLATAIYHEARGESVRGQQAVAQVIMNRVRLNYYPNTICGVVYEGSDRLNSCQFSFACDRKSDAPREKREWEIANEIAQDTIDGKIWLPEVGTASHYHATYVNPRWTHMMTRTTRIGIHVFYRGKFLGPVDIASSGEDPDAHIQ